MGRETSIPWFVTGALLAGCGGASDGGSSVGDSSETTAASDTTGESTTEDTAAQVDPWFELGQGEEMWTPLPPGSDLGVVRGSQGLDMFTLVVRGGDFDRPELENPARLEVWVDVEDHNLLPNGHFAYDPDSPIVFEDVGEDVLEYVFHPLIIPQYAFPLSDLDGLDATLGARLTVEVAGAPETLHWSVPVTIDAEPIDDGDTGGDGGGVDVGEGPIFVDVSDDVGLGDITTAPALFAPDCPWDDGTYCHPLWFVGGASVADFDDDGDPDIFLPVWDSQDKLLRNDGGVFTDVAVEAACGKPRAPTAPDGPISTTTEISISTRAFSRASTTSCTSTRATAPSPRRRRPTASTSTRDSHTSAPAWPSATTTSMATRI